MEDNKPVETTEQDALNTPELNRAAYTFYTTIPRIKALSSTIGGKALARVFKAVIEFPLADKEPKFRSKTEQELFILSLSAMSAKTTMASAYIQNAKELEDEITTGVVDQMLTEAKEEVSNG